MNESQLIFLLFAGLPGVGKTTLSCELGRHLQWHVIDKDALKKAFMDQGLENEAAGYIAYEQAFETAYHVLTNEKRSVILDSAALQKFIVARAREDVSAIPHVKLKVILCVADRDLRNDRMRKRPSQITTIHIDPATIVDYFQIFSHLPEDTCILYTNRPLKECLADAIKYLETR
jgi:predicted kinase